MILAKIIKIQWSLIGHIGLHPGIIPIYDRDINTSGKKEKTNILIWWCVNIALVICFCSMYPRLVYIDSTLSSANKVKGHTTNSNALQRNCLMRTGQTRYVATRLCCVIFWLNTGLSHVGSIMLGSYLQVYLAFQHLWWWHDKFLHLFLHCLWFLLKYLIYSLIFILTKCPIIRSVCFTTNIYISEYLMAWIFRFSQSFVIVLCTKLI